MHNVRFAADGVEKLGLIDALTADSVFPLIWEADWDDGAEEGAASGPIL